MLFRARPLPIPDFGHVLPIGGDVLRVLDQLVADELFEMGGGITELGHAVDDVGNQVKAIQVVAHRHIERCGGSALFFVSPHMQVVMVGAAVGQAVNQPGVAVISEYDGLVCGEQDIEILV